MAASVGAAGMNDKNRGWSMEMLAGPRTSAKMRSASRPPIPLGVTVRPTMARNSAAERVLSSGGGSRRIRSRA